MIRKPTQSAYVSTFVTSLFIQGCTVLQGILLARLLGPVGRGEFASVILWPTIFAGFGILGVNMALARIAGQGWDINALAKTAVKAALFTGIITMLICGSLLPILLPLEKHSLLPAAYLFLVFIPINHLGLNLQSVDHGLGNFRWLNITRALLYPVFFVGIVLAWCFAIDAVYWGAAAMLVANSSVVLVRLFRFKNLLRKSNEITCSVLRKESSPFVIANIISILYMQMDKALLVWLLTPEEIGWYVAAFAASSSINVINGALGIVQFSTSAQEESRKGFENLAKVLRRSFLITLVCSCVFAILLPWVLPCVYGEDFRPAIKVAYLLLPGIAVAGLGDIVSEALRGQGQPIAAVTSKVLGLVVMGLIGFVLSRIFGGKGIALGYLAGEFVASAGFLIIATRYYKDANWTILLPSREDVVFLKMCLLNRS